MHNDRQCDRCYKQYNSDRDHAYCPHELKERYAIATRSGKFSNENIRYIAEDKQGYMVCDHICINAKGVQENEIYNYEYFAEKQIACLVCGKNYILVECYND